MTLTRTARLVRRITVGCLMTISALSHASDCKSDTKCVLVLGNSLTNHLPSPAVNWTGSWGMAASDADKDFVAQLLKRLNGVSPKSSWSARKEGSGDLERNPSTFRVNDDVAHAAARSALVIVEVGDNVDTGKTPLPTFGAAYAASLKALKPRSGTLACISTWWVSAEKDKLIKESCEQAGGVFVDISEIARNPLNVARNERHIEHDGVGAHPGDAGMKAIADKIFASLPRK